MNVKKRGGGRYDRAGYARDTHRRLNPESGCRGGGARMRGGDAVGRFDERRDFIGTWEGKRKTKNRF